MSVPRSPEPGYDRAAEPGRGQPLSSAGAILGDISRDISTLMRQEVELAKLELRQTATQAGKGGGMLAGAAVGGHMLLVFVSIAGWWALGDVTGRGWSALVVAAIWAVIAAILAVAGRSELRSVKGLPRTTETAKEIPAALTGTRTADDE